MFRVLKQSHDKKVKEIFEPITEQLTEAIDSTKSLTENTHEIVPVEIDSDNCGDENAFKANIRPVPNSSHFCDKMTKTFAALMESPNLSSNKSTPTGASILEVPIPVLGNDTMIIFDTNYELTDETYKTLSLTGYTGDTMKKNSEKIIIGKTLENLEKLVTQTDLQNEKKNFSRNYLKELQKLKLNF